LQDVLTKAGELERQIKDLLDDAPVPAEPARAEIEAWMLRHVFRELEGARRVLAQRRGASRLDVAMPERPLQTRIVKRLKSFPRSARRDREMTWLIVTRNDQPLLYDGRMPMFWSRQVARRHLHPWMMKGGCRVTRAVVAVLRRGAGRPKPSRPVRRKRSQKTRRGDGER
jgi:hypothetical protein